MTNTEQLNQVRAKIIEAVPEIRRTKWRCRTCNEQTFFELENLHIFDCANPDPVEEVFAGRPITLADVLRAIDKFYKPQYDSYAVTVFPSGAIEIMDFGGGYEPATTVGEAMWALNVPLNEQEPEVISFLHKILCQ